MTPAERVRAVYHWQTPDYVPFTICETKVKGRPYEKELMDLDICCIRRIESFRIVQGGDVTVQTEEKDLPGGRRSVHKTVHTHHRLDPRVFLQGRKRLRKAVLPLRPSKRGAVLR